MRPLSRERAQTVRYQTPQRLRFSKEHYLLRKPFDLSVSTIQEPVKKYLKPTIRVTQLQQRMNKFTYLPLHYFEDTLFDKFSNLELFLKIQQNGPLKAQILVENKNYEFIDGIITSYVAKSDEFLFQAGQVNGTIRRLFFVCDFEDPKKYIQKFDKALQDRESMDSYLRYNYYIDNMQTQDIPDMPTQSLQRIIGLIKEGGTGMVPQILAHYKRVQNQMTFDAYLRNNKDILNLEFQKKEIYCDFGKMQLNFKEMTIVHKDFIDIQPTSFIALKRQFQEVSLFTYPEFIKSFYKINELNRHITSLELLYWDKLPFSILLLKEKQDSLAHRQMKQISKWSESIKEIMLTCIQELKSRNIEIPNEKLKRIIRVIRIKQQDALHKLVKGNLILFKRRLSGSQIVYYISVGYFGDFCYCYEIKEIVNAIKNSLEMQLQELSKIRDPECIMGVSDLMYLECKEEESIVKFIAYLNQEVEKMNKLLIDHLRAYFKYRYIFEWQLNDFVRDCTINYVFDLQLFKKQIEKLNHLQLQLTKELQLTDQISVFSVHNSHLLFQINQLIEQNIHQMIEYVVEQANSAVNKTIAEFQKLLKQIRKQSNDILGLEQQRIFLTQDVHQFLNQLQILIKESLTIYEVLDDLSYIGTHEQMKERYNLLSFIHILEQEIDSSVEELIKERNKQKGQFLEDLINFKYQIDQVEHKVNKFIRNYSEEQNQSQTFMKELLELKEQARLNNQYEAIFNLPSTDFGKIDFIIQSLEPLEILQVFLAQWNQCSWMQTPIEQLEAQKIKDFIESSLQSLNTVIEYATEKRMASIQSLSQKMLSQIQAFQPHLPIIFSLTEPGMRERHWNELNQRVGSEIPNSKINFQELLNLLDQIDVLKSINSRAHLIEISHNAQQELIIEKTYNQLIQEYKNLSAQVMKARLQVQYNKILNLQNLFQKLDDGLCTLSVILQSKFHQPWQKELNELENAMINSQTLVSEMEQMQLLMSYIHPVFQQSDLQKQLPIEVSRFKAVEKFWKTTTSEFQLVHKFKNDSIHEWIIKLQTIEKTLNNYIDKKREIFQRFHFLSNQQILMIQSRQPNDFINQLFSFDSVVLDEDGIIQLKIGDKEHLDISRVNIYSKCVEDWLHELITAMRKALKLQILKNQQCKQISRILQKFEWTYALDNGFKDFNTAQASHSDLQKFKYLSSIEPDSFEYAMQLRYYLNEEQSIIIRILQYSFEYDYEFQRCDDQFINTPQTDRCYAHLAFAIGNHFGAYIYGNSAKIETIKGFANEIGKYFIVMNANLSNYQILAHLCKGVSATGTYLTLTKCSEVKYHFQLDETGSVINFCVTLRNQLSLIEFEGQTVKVVPTFAFFLIGDHTNRATDELRHFFRIIYLTKLDLNIQIEYLGQQYGITQLMQVKQFVHLYTSLKQDLSTAKLRLLFKSAKQDGMHKALVKHFPDLQEKINLLFDNQVKYKIELQDLLSESNYVLIYGPSLSGKSFLISKIEKIRKIYISSFNFESYFGTFDTEGTLSEMLNHKGTLVFDGEIDERMIEMLIQLVLFQQMRFPNGKVLQINNNIIFETPSIYNLSPNTITRLALLYQSEIQIEIPNYAQMFVCLSDIYKSPITKDQQMQHFKQILTQIKGTSTQEFEAVYAAIWAFGSALNGERKLLMNRHIKEIWGNMPQKTVDPLTYGNLFDYALVDGELLDVGVDNLSIQKYTKNILLFGESGSGKTAFLKNPLTLNMCSTSQDILTFVQRKSIKKRNQTYSVGRVDIDDLHLPITKNCNELLRQFLDDYGCHRIRFTDIEIVATTSILKQQRLLRYFLPFYCETPSLDKIFATIHVENTPVLKDIYRQAVEQFKNSRHLKITHYDLSRCLDQSNPCQSLLQSIYFKTDDDNLRLQFISSQKLFKIDPIVPDYSDLFEKENLVQFEANTMLLNYLVKCNSKQIIIYGPFGMGKKTLAKLVCQVSGKEYLLLDDPKLDQLSQVVNQQVIVTLTTENLLNYCARSNLIYKFQLIHHGPWPEEVFSDICGYQIYQHAKFTNIYPKLYIDYTLLQNRLFQERSNSIQKRISQLSQGLQLLYSAQQAVNQMNSKLTMLQPTLESAVRETQEMVSVLKIHTQSAQAAREQILQDEQLAEEEQKKATQLSEICKARVLEVNQLLDETLSEMQKLKKDHLVEIKSLLQPPKAVKVVLGGVVILLSEVFRVPIQDDYFEVGKKHLLNDVKELLEILRNYQRDTIPSSIIQQLEAKIISDPEFTLERAKQCSLAVKYLYTWVRAMYDYHKVFTETKPLRDQLQNCTQELQIKSQDLQNKRKELHEINEKLESYEMQVKEKQKVKEQLQSQIDQCQTKISRSIKLIEGFQEEQKRWTTLIYHMKGEETRNEGDSIIAASIITYGGPLTREERDSFYKYLRRLLADNEIKFTEQCTLNTYLNIDENACILKYRKRPALLIDAQDLGRKYLKSQNYPIVKEQRKIQQFLQLKQVFCIDVSEDQQLIFDMNAINIARKPLDSQNRYQVINFTITQDVLTEMVLKCFIELENPSLELKKDHNIQLIEKDNVKLNQIEEQILHILQNRSIEELLGDETLINELRNSKIIYEETSKRIEMSKRLSEEIDVSRDQYRMLAQQLSRVYFVILELQNLNNLYQYSLDWFLNQLIKHCGKIDRQTQVALNIQSMKQSFYKGIINEVGQFLTEQHRLIFCFKISLDILRQRGLVNDLEISCFSTRVPQKISMNPCIFIDDSIWQAIYEKLVQLEKLPAFAGILEDIEDHPNTYKQLYLHQIFTTEQQKLTQFQKLLLTNAFRPDKVVVLMINQIEQVLQLKYTFEKVEVSEKMLLILNDSNFYSKLSLTLGEGQNEKAEKMLKEAIELGNTVELRNCQFGNKFLNQIESIFEEDSKIHPNFKIILQLQQCDSFPIQWLYRTTKIASQKPHTLIDTLIQQIEKLPNADHPRYFSLNLFHAIMNLRYLFGYWPYQFHESDLKLMLDKKQYLKELVYQSQFPEEDAELMNSLYVKCVCQQSLREGFIYMGGELKLIKADRDGYLQYLRDMGSVNDFNCIGLNSNSQIIIQNETMQYIQQGFRKVNSNTVDLLEQLEKLERYTPLKLGDVVEGNMLDIYYAEEQTNFNKLIDCMNEDVRAIQQYLRGGMLESPSTFDTIQKGEVPIHWINYSGVCEKKFNIWLNRVFEKGQFLSKWSSQITYNLSYLRNPKLFLNLIKLQYSKQLNSEVQFQYSFLREHHLEIKERPAEGIYISGLRLSGAKYNEISQKMKPLGHLEFYSDLPVLHLKCSISEQEYKNYFMCPVVCNNQVIMELKFETSDSLIQLGVKIII